MSQTKDLTGMRFGRWTVIDKDTERTKSAKVTYWNCICECGSIKSIRHSSLTTGNSRSCGCLHDEVVAKNHYKHGAYHDNLAEPLYYVWNTMRQRCGNPNSEKYKRYGARGITVCEAWNDYATFREWALSNGYKPNSGLSIDRIDNDKGYCPENCRWVTNSVQSNNRSTNHIVTIHGEKHNIAQWAEIYNMNPQVIRGRIHAGWNEVDAITTKIGDRPNG